jgi:uncharacterized membrane-anchored protein YjiN (DUF445 family)
MNFGSHAVRDPAIDARRALARHRILATALLVIMAGLTAGSYALPRSWMTDLLQAAAKAGFVGGVADWFAVTALFRRPLGLPIPHTAIIPAQKVRLGRALGRFVANHVFTPEDVARMIGQLDLPGIVQRVLGEPRAVRSAAQALAGIVPRLLAAAEDGRAGRMITGVLPRLVGGAGAGAVMARVLRALVDGGRHQDALDYLIEQIRKGLVSNEESLRRAIAEKVSEHGGRLVGWAIGANVARRVLSAVSEELDKMGPAGSELRASFETWIRSEIDQLEHDRTRAAEIGAAIRRVMSHEAVRSWLWDIWRRMRRSMEADAAAPGGRAIRFLEDTLVDIGRSLTEDPVARARLETAARSAIGAVLPSAREELANFIAAVIGGWDTKTITDRLELHVGKDLQYVRINGTVVGFLIGGVVYLLLNWIFGYSI